ncbi:MAG: FkbM family methyltransferase [Bacteroidota bacterium]|jgi:FkbM family methyltransferase
MEKKLRAFLLKALGYEKYLALISDVYIRLIKSGFLAKKYPELFYLKQIIKPGFVCIDIGANVGYYSSFLSNHVASSGKVIAVEPVPLFANVFELNLQKFGLSNVTLLRNALGGERKKITMGTPMIDGVFRHGLTKVVEDNDATMMQTYEVEMCVPDELFAPYARIDFIKCDVEGYEVLLFPHMMKTIDRCKPMIQIEISSSENRSAIINLLSPLGYRVFALQQNQLVPIQKKEALTYEGGDFYFLCN